MSEPVADGDAPSGFTVTTVPTVAEVTALLRISRPGRRRRLLRLAALAVVLAGLAIGASGAPGRVVLLVAIWVLVALLSLAQPWVAPRLNGRRIGIGLPVTWTFDPVGVSSTTERSTVAVPWAQVSDVRVRGDLLVLEFGPRSQPAALPVAALGPGDDLASVLTWSAAAGVRTHR